MHTVADKTPFHAIGQSEPFCVACILLLICMHTFADKTPFHAIGRIVQEEGVVKGLYRGLTLNYIKTVPNVAIYMSLYDVCKNFLIARAQKVWCAACLWCCCGVSHRCSAACASLLRLLRYKCLPYI